MSEDLHASFRPRSARLTTVVLGILTVVGAIVVIVTVPRISTVSFGVADQSGVVLLALGIVWFLWRQGSVSAVPDDAGLRVRNIIHTRRVEWAQIVAVTFPAGAPWVQLDLSDGDTLAVMAIQRADGERGQAESRRLATLVALHSGG